MGKVQVEKSRLLYDGFFKVEEATLRFEKFSGEMSASVRRLSVERGDSVAAIVLNRSSNTVLLVNQFKYPTLRKGPGWITEVVAGGVEPNEEPEAAIRREIAEEIGYSVHELIPISTFYVSPGGSSERIALYYAEVDDDSQVSRGGGDPDENEDIRTVSLRPAELWNALDENQIQDAKTIIAAMWLRKRMT